MTKQPCKISGLNSHFSPARLIIALMLFSMITSLMICTAGYGSEPAFLPIKKSKLPIVYFKGFNIPRFPTAQGQLNFAKSWFAHGSEKRAALRIVSKLFPRARLQCGNAALVLAYMNMGDDYRFAAKKDFLKAITDYRKILDQYSDQPVIMAKAHWYLGWIHCDLLSEKTKGIVHFKIIASHYPGVTMELSSPVPWVSLVYPLNPVREKKTIQTPEKHWAGIALLEIIRHAPTPAEAITAFDALWAGYKNSVETGFALKIMLENPLLTGHIRSRLPLFLARNIANPYLAEELLNLAEKNQAP